MFFIPEPEHTSPKLAALTAKGDTMLADQRTCTMHTDWLKQVDNGRCLSVVFLPTHTIRTAHAHDYSDGSYVFFSVVAKDLFNFVFFFH